MAILTPFYNMTKQIGNIHSGLLTSLMGLIKVLMNLNLEYPNKPLMTVQQVTLVKHLCSTKTMYSWVSMGKITQIAQQLLEVKTSDWMPMNHSFS